ncbi:MAG: hypothetical protein P8M20_01905 [Planctomycetaceae bacterium]|nr:hypothetical protein [Planctomycetaceae bacterium]
MSDLKTNLVQSVDAAARVGVLFVAVAMFAAMWESDLPSTSSSDNHCLARRTGVISSIANADDGQIETTDRSQSHAGRASVFKLAEMQIGTAQAYPIPAGIAAGEYRVVDSLGMMDTLRVTAEMVSLHRSHKASDQYIIENSDRKIYFIRIQGTPSIASAHLKSILR